MSLLPALTIIGCGKLGTTLGKLWHHNKHFAIRQLWSRQPEHAYQAAKTIGSGEAVTGFDNFSPADIWLIATPDDTIENVLMKLHDSHVLKAGDTVFHCSGSLSSEILDTVRPTGVYTASMHPLHSFSDPDISFSQFFGSFCAFEGNHNARQLLKPAFEAIGGNVFDIATETKTLYHAGSVIACNYLAPLLNASLKCFDAAAISRDLSVKLLNPIVHQTIDNILSQGPAEALTGPIARGDLETVKRHAQQLDTNLPETLPLYLSLAEETVKVALQQKDSSNKNLETIEKFIEAIKVQQALD